MNFEWDEAKRKMNIKKHGIDFIDAKEAFEGYTVTVEDDRIDYGEKRFVTLGIIKGRVVMVVHTETDDTIRIISMRKAKKNEQKAYFAKITN